MSIRTHRFPILALLFFWTVSPSQIFAQDAVESAAEASAYDLINDMKQAGVTMTPRVEQAFAQIPRAEFLPDYLVPQASKNRPLPLGGSRVLVQPDTLAKLFSRASVEAPSRVLIIGQDTIYAAALASKIFPFVLALESLPKASAIPVPDRLASSSLVIAYQQALADLNDTQGFGFILIHGGTPSLPSQVLNYLTPNGILAVPLMDEDGYQTLILLKFENGRLARVEDMGRCYFAPGDPLF